MLKVYYIILRMGEILYLYERAKNYLLRIYVHQIKVYGFADVLIENIKHFSRNILALNKKAKKNRWEAGSL